MGNLCPTHIVGHTPSKRILHFEFARMREPSKWPKTLGKHYFPEKINEIYWPWDTLFEIEI